MLKRLTLAFLLGLTPALLPLALHAKEETMTAEAAMDSEELSVNINTADADILAKRLNGIGKSRAEAIVRYRDTYGPFLTADDLLEVKGVGRSTLDKNRDIITLE